MSADAPPTSGSARPPGSAGSFPFRPGFRQGAGPGSYRGLRRRPWHPRRGTAVPRRRPAVQRRRRTLLGAVALVVVAAVVLLADGSGAGPVSVRVTLPATSSVGAQGALEASSPAASGHAGSTGPGAPALPWPATGSAAVSVPLLGYTAQSGSETPVPVASLAKIMTAYVVLHDHPLAPGSQGPDIVVTAADAAQFGTDTVTDQASVEVQAGEVLTEYQMLEGLLVHSANDLAYALACWDAGTVPAFVARMNATAAALGMAGSHFADASGFDSATTSTAADMLKVAAAAMASPVFAQIVAMPAVTLPVAGAVESYTPLVGTEGVVGVKSGFTSAAGGGDVLAYSTSVGGRSLTVLADVISQEGPTVLDQAGDEALALARAVSSEVLARTVAPAGEAVGRVVDGDERAVEMATVGPATLLAMPGSTVRQAVDVRRRPGPGAPAGTRVGTATFTLGEQSVSVPVRTTATLP